MTFSVKKLRRFVSHSSSIYNSTSYIVQTTAALASVTAEHLVRASLEPTDDLSIDPPLLSHHIHKPLKVTLRIVRTIYIIPNPISLLLSNEIFHTLYISYLASSHITQSTMHNSGVLVADVGQFNVNTGTHSNQLAVTRCNFLFWKNRSIDDF